MPEWTGGQTIFPGGNDMPFIDSKVTVTLPQDKRDQLKKRLGEAISLLGKPESYLMLGFEQEYDLYMGGKKLEKGAFVSVSLFGSASSQACEKMTARICSIFEEELGIPGDAIYITYTGLTDWGWNGKNF